MIQALASYLLAAMVAWVPVSNHASFEPPAVTEAHYRAIAEDVAAVSAEDPIFPGRDGAARTAILLGAIASYESHFASRVDDCTVTGDHGQAFGLWQTHAKRVLVCGDRRTAARVARDMVRSSFRSCRGLDVLDRLGEYTDGVCRANWNRSRWRVGRAVRWLEHTPWEQSIAAS